MPELPEVETIVRDLRKHLLNQRFVNVRVLDGRVLRNCSARPFARRLKNELITGITRIGKAVVFKLSSGGYLTVQPMMSGKLIYSQEFISLTPANSTKIIFKLSRGGYLQYNDFRMFGRVNILKSLNDLEFFNTLGPDPFTKNFNTEWIRGYLQSRRAPIKPLLMDQRFVAGIGNIYASEILFRSRISPLRSGHSLKPGEIQRLHKMTVDILKEAVDFRGTSMRTYRDTNNEKGSFINRLQVYDRQDRQCLRCRATVRKVVQAGRSTFFCRKCQT
jgi:formamidopyrimidine-DNA glycosylase